MLNDCACVIPLDTTTHPWWREKVMAYYYFIYIYIIYHDFSLHLGGVVMSSQIKHTHSHQDDL